MEFLALALYIQFFSSLEKKGKIFGPLIRL